MSHGTAAGSVIGNAALVDTYVRDKERLFQRFLAAESRIGLGFFILGVLVSHRPDHPAYCLMADIQRSQGIHCLSCSPIDAAGCHFGYRVEVAESTSGKVPTPGTGPVDRMAFRLRAGPDGGRM